MRELDTLLEAFLERSFAALDDAERRRLAVILELPDPELQGYLLGGREPADPELAELLHRIRQSLHPQT